MRFPRLVTLSMLALSGCASMFMNGGKLVDKGYAPMVKSSWVAPSCTLSAGGATVAGPAGVKFQLAQEGMVPGLFERSPDGSGSMITNGWSDEVGDHYFGWVQRSGWEYVFPRNPAQQPMRVVYVGLQVAQVGASSRPATPVSALCPLFPSN
jgi:hypothetical protein